MNIYDLDDYPRDCVKCGNMFVAKYYSFDDVCPNCQANSHFHFSDYVPEQQDNDWERKKE